MTLLRHQVGAVGPACGVANLLADLTEPGIEFFLIFLLPDETRHLVATDLGRSLYPAGLLPRNCQPNSLRKAR